MYDPGGDHLANSKRDRRATASAAHNAGLTPPLKLGQVNCLILDAAPPPSADDHPSILPITSRRVNARPQHGFSDANATTDVARSLDLSFTVHGQNFKPLGDVRLAYAAALEWA